MKRCHRYGGTFSLLHLYDRAEGFLDARQERKSWMINRTIAIVGSLLLLLVAVGAVQVVAGLTGEDGEAVEAAFPDVEPYTEPTATATPVELPEADVPGEDIPDVPRYPGSVRVAYGTTETDSASSVELEYQTLDALDPVHEHVRAIIDTYDWALTQEAFSGQERAFVLVRDHEEVQIRLRTGEGRTVISMHYSVTRQPEPTPEPEPEVVTEPVNQPQSEPEPVAEPPPDAEPEPEQPAVQEAPPAEPDQGGSDEQEAVEAQPENDEQEGKPEDKPEKNDNENDGPENINGNGNGPSEDKGPDDKKDNGDNEDKKEKDKKDD